MTELGIERFNNISRSLYQQMFETQNKFKRLYSVNFVVESQCIYTIEKIVSLPLKSFVPLPDYSLS